MNLKLETGALRFRITSQELKKLLDGQFLEEKITIGNATLALVIDPKGQVERLLPVYEYQTVRLLISPSKVRELEELGRSREGIQETYGDTEISLQVDFRTQKRQDA